MSERYNEEGKPRCAERGSVGDLTLNHPGKEIVAVINAATQGFVVVQRERLHALLNSEPCLDDKISRRDDDERTPPTPRELEALAAMADGLSNKAIVRRLAISEAVKAEA